MSWTMPATRTARGFPSGAVISMVAPTVVLATRIAARSITISPGGGGQLPFSGVR